MILPLLFLFLFFTKFHSQRVQIEAEDVYSLAAKRTRALLCITLPNRVAEHHVKPAGKKNTVERTSSNFAR
jgi:hypothetical protein